MKKLILFLFCFSLLVASQAAVSIPLELKTAVTDVSGLVSVGLVALITFFGLFFAYKSGVALVMFAGNTIKRFMRGGDDSYPVWASNMNSIDNASTDLQLRGFGDDFASNYRDHRFSGNSARDSWKAARHIQRESVYWSKQDRSQYKEF